MSTFTAVDQQYNTTPRLIVVDQANGSTLTRATIRAFTPQDFEDQAFKEVGMDRIIGMAKEARMAGVCENGLKDLLLSRHVALRQNRGGGSGSIIAPFTLIPRRNRYNANYFQIEAGAAHPSAGVGSIPASAWNITVNVGSSPWVTAPSSGLKNLEKFFLPGCNVIIEYKEAVTNTARTVQGKILAAVNADSGAVSKAVVTIEPNLSIAGWGALSVANQTIQHPTAGQVSLLHNSISDYESWGHQFPAVNPLTLVEYWQQTIRSAWSYNEEYLKALQAPLTSEFFKKFRELPMAEQRRQNQMRNDMMGYNTIFYGQEINEKQTVEGYTNLPLVVDPADASYPIEYKANTLGIRTQLARAGRINDRQNQPLDLDVIFESAYNLKRNRQGDCGNQGARVIDVMTDRITKGRIRSTMLQYYKGLYASGLEMHYTPGQKIDFNGASVFEYDRYELPDQNVQLAVFTDDYFDDRLSAFSTAQKSRGRALWIIDWSDIQINVIKTNSAKRTTNEADELYRYVITPNVKHTMLNSKTIEVRVGDPNRHQLIENFSDDTPNVSVQGADVF